MACSAMLAVKPRSVKERSSDHEPGEMPPRYCQSTTAVDSLGTGSLDRYPYGVHNLKRWGQPSLHQGIHISSLEPFARDSVNAMGFSVCLGEVLRTLEILGADVAALLESMNLSGERRLT